MPACLPGKVACGEQHNVARAVLRESFPSSSGDDSKADLYVWGGGQLGQVHVEPAWVGFPGDGVCLSHRQQILVMRELDNIQETRDRYSTWGDRRAEKRYKRDGEICCPLHPDRARGNAIGVKMRFPCLSTL